MANLDAILNKKCVAYKVIEPTGPRGLALRFEDGTVLTVDLDYKEPYGESPFVDITVVSPDDDQWVTQKGI